MENKCQFRIDSGSAPLSSLPEVGLLSSRGSLLYCMMIWFPGRSDPNRASKELKMTTPTPTPTLTPPLSPPPWLDHPGSVEKVKASHDSDGQPLKVLVREVIKSTLWCQCEL